MSTQTEPTVVAAAQDDEPESVRQVSGRAKGLLISVPILAGLGFLLGYPAMVAVAVRPRKPLASIRRCPEPVACR